MYLLTVFLSYGCVHIDYSTHIKTCQVKSFNILILFKGDKMKIIERIFNIMKANNIKNVTLAEKLNINKSVISNWKTRNTNPPSEMIIPICELLNVSPIYILTGKEDFNNLTNEEINLLKKYNLLNERNKGQINNFIDERLNEQNQVKSNKDLT